jgi:SAM-dependent methyltransferase
MSSYTITNCLCCGGANLRMALDLGMQPPANSYTESAAERVEEFPLGLNVCQDCWNSQLSYCVDRQQIFDQYAYVSGTSKTLTQFFAWFSGALARSLPAGGRVLELAANDGSLIREMQRAGLECVGVDPAANITAQAQAAGLPVLCGYWPQAATQIDGQFDAIVCMNVVAHVDDPLAFLAGCREKLRAGGTVLVQPSQARMFENGEFDTMYHEHISFFNTRSMARLAERAGLRLVDTFLVKVHGDSPVYMLQHADGPGVTQAAAFRAPFLEGEFAINESLPEYEQRIGLFDWSTYERFGDTARAVVDGVVKLVDEQRAAGKAIVFVGAAAKAMTLVNAARVQPDMFLDENPLRIGLHAPGSGCRIEALDACAKLDRPALFVFSAWNFRHELAAKVRAIGVPAGSVLYSYFPTAQYL